MYIERERERERKRDIEGGGVAPALAPRGAPPRPPQQRAS